MGNIAATTVQVIYSKNTNDYELDFVNENENPKFKFNADNKIVQTAGTPLDSNTIHHVSEEIKKTFI